MLRQNQVYFRRGSKNDVAGPEDLKRIITWINSSGGGEGGFQAAPPGDVQTWPGLLRALHEFETGRHYVLVSALGGSAAPDGARFIGQLDWSLVLDMDPDSEAQGLLKVSKSSIEDRKSLHLQVIGDRIQINPMRSTSWFFARGLVGREETLSTGSWRTWQQRYGNEIRQQLSLLAAAVNPSPITVVALFYDATLADHLASMFEIALASFGENTDFVVICGSQADVHAVAAKFGAESFVLPLEHVCAGLDAWLSPRRSRPSDATALPANTGVTILLGRGDENWIQEEVEIVHLGLGQRTADARVVGRDFLRGMEVDLYELALHYDVDRDIARSLTERVHNDLARRQTTRINLYHPPGAGGTTVARRLAWDTHFKYPCGILRRTDPRHTADRLYKLTSMTGNPFLLLIDGSDVSGGGD